MTTATTSIPGMWSRRSACILATAGSRDILAANLMPPLVGLARAVFAGRYMARELTRDELALGEGPDYGLWRVLIRYLAPPAIALGFLHASGLA